MHILVSLEQVLQFPSQLKHVFELFNLYVPIGHVSVQVANFSEYNRPVEQDVHVFAVPEQLLHVGLHL